VFSTPTRSLGHRLYLVSPPDSIFGQRPRPLLLPSTQPTPLSASGRRSAARPTGAPWPDLRVWGGGEAAKR